MRKRRSQQKMKRLKKTFIIVASIIAIILASLYIYSQGGFQNIHVAKGEGLDDAKEMPVKDLINNEFAVLIHQNIMLRTNADKNFLEKTLYELDRPSSFEVMYKTDDRIYWGTLRRDFLRDNVVYLYYSDRKEYDQIMQSKEIHPINDTEKWLRFYIDEQYPWRRVFAEDSDSIRVVISEMTLKDNGADSEILYGAYINGHKTFATSKDGTHFDHISY